MIVLCLSVAHASTAQTDEVGGRDQQVSGNKSYKLNLYGMGGQGVRLDLIEVYLQPSAPNSELHFVVYQEAADGWDLVWDSGSVVISNGAGFKESPAPSLDLLPNESYAIGVYLGADSFDYVFSTVDDELIGWSIVNGVLWADSGTVNTLPDPITGGNDGFHHYNQRITVDIPDDADHDGFDEFSDCNDADPKAFPGAPERCNAADDNCDGAVDEGLGYDWYADADGDGFGDPNQIVGGCEPPVGAVDDATDCDDGSADVHPGATEACNGRDDDCDPATQEPVGCEETTSPDPIPVEPDVFAEDLVVNGGCSCDGAGPAGSAVGLLVLGALVRRRR